MPGAERVPASCGASDALPRASPARPLAPWRPRKHPSSNCGPPLGLRAAARPAGGGLAGRSWRAGRRRKWIENNRGTQVDLRGDLGAQGAAGALGVFQRFSRGRGGAGARKLPAVHRHDAPFRASGPNGRLLACFRPPSPLRRGKKPRKAAAAPALRAPSGGARGAGIGAAEEACGGKSIPPDPSVGLPAGKAGRRWRRGGGALPAAELEVALWLPHGNEHLLELLVGDLRGDAPLRG